MSDLPTAIVAELVRLLIEARKRHGLSQETVARRAGLSRGGIGHMESGRTTPTLVSLIKIAGVLDVDLSKLLRKAMRQIPSSAERENHAV